MKSWEAWNDKKTEGDREGGRAPTEQNTASYQEQLMTRSCGTI